LVEASLGVVSRAVLNLYFDCFCPLVELDGGIEFIKALFK